MTKDKVREISYHFSFEDNDPWVYVLQFDEDHYFLPKEGREIKDWTLLEKNKCPNCPLQGTPQCPVARNLDAIVEDSKDTLSCKEALVTVTTPERTYSQKCGTQDGLRSLFGLIMASSGCPHLDWLRPLARFHLPFADTHETLFRVLSLELLKQYFMESQESKEGVSHAIERQYSEIEKVNHTFIERIRSYCKGDADKNAIVALDVYVQLFEFQKQSDFKDLAKYF